jgi:hypothetical protein
MYHDQILKRMQAIGIKRKTLALLSSVSAPKLSDFLNGHCELPNGKDKQLDRILEDIASLQEYFPVPIGTADSKLLRVALERFKKHKFDRYRDLTKELAATFEQEAEPEILTQEK